MSDADDLADEIDQVADGAAESTNLAGERVKTHPLPHLEQTLKRKQREESARSGRLPIRMFKMRPPGAL